MTLGKVATLGFLVVFAVILAFAMNVLPEAQERMNYPGPTGQILEDGLRETGAVNLVTAVLFDYRGFDTLGEATVIFAAVAGVALVFYTETLVLSKQGLSSLAKEGMNILTPFIVLLGLYVILHGHISPGGGFQGGVILASWAILACLVYGVEVEEKVMSDVTKMLAESSGVILFVIVAGISFLVGAQFLSNLTAGFGAGSPGGLLSAGAIPYLNVAIGIKVAAGLAVMFVTMAKKDVLK